MTNNTPPKPPGGAPTPSDAGKGKPPAGSAAQKGGAAPAATGASAPGQGGAKAATPGGSGTPAPTGAATSAPTGAGVPASAGSTAPTPSAAEPAARAGGTSVPPTTPRKDPPPERVQVPVTRRRADVLPLVLLVAAGILAAGLWYLYTNPPVPAVVAQDSAQLDTVQRLVGELSGRVTRLEARVGQLGQQPQPAAPAADARPAAPPPPTVDLRPLEQRLAALERQAADRPAPSPPPPAAPDLSPQLKQLADRLAEVEARTAPAATGTGTQLDLAQVAARLDALAGRQDALTARQQADLTALQGRIASLDGQRQNDLGGVQGRITALDGRVATVEQQSGQVGGTIRTLQERAARIGRLQAAAAALETGRPLGALPDAPPALARWADRAPPTEGQLRAQFDAAARAAHAASQPAITEDKPFLSALWTRAQQVVTVRQGDRVLLGDPVAGVLQRARRAIDLGDLRGAIQALDGLAGPAAAAMAEWRGQAQALLDARTALAEAAARG